VTSSDRVAVGRELRALARLEAASPPLAQVETWASDEYERMDPERVLDRDRYVHAFITCHETLEDARAEWLYLQQHPNEAGPLRELAEYEIANYTGEHPVGACKLAISRPHVTREVRIPLRKEYIAMFNEAQLDTLIAIFQDYMNEGEPITESERRSLVHELVFQEMPSVFGLSFDDGSQFPWAVIGYIDFGDEDQRAILKDLIEAALVGFSVEGTRTAGDVLLVRIAREPWGTAGLALFASKRPGRVHLSLEGFELDAEQVAKFDAVGWENLRDDQPDALLVKEAWTRQAHELAVEAIWALETAHPTESTGKIVWLYGSEVVAAASDTAGWVASVDD